MIGLVAIILFFAGGLLFFVNIRTEKKGWAVVEAVQKTSRGPRWELAIRNGPGGPRVFREIISSPKGRLAPLADKKKKDEFGVRFVKGEDGQWTIVEVAAPEEE